MNHKIIRFSTALFIIAALFSGCGFWKKQSPPRNAPEALYQRGYEDYQRGKYKKAIEAFQRLNEEYPLSELAIMAEIGIADAYFSDKEYVDAALSYTDFINLHPLNEHVPYAHYQIAMCHYKQIDTIDRDQTETYNAKTAFERLISRFPESKFRPLAENMLKECNIKLAEHELYVGRLYFKMKKYQAALQRFEKVTKDYAGLGLEAKTNQYISETQKRLAAMEKSKIN
ncbi:MAG: outer membrane protein assembly factor BamD [Deltaproteobacteria bacterium]|nr:outer membrane protein assembly factor BamD [Deltaproteobacteria bacterium]